MDDKLKQSNEDIALWCDGTWCFRYEIDEFLSFMSDDFSIINEDSDEWKQILEEKKEEG